MQLKSKIWYLENFNFFSELTMEQRIFVRQNIEMKTIQKNEIVYFQDDPANSVYFLKEGKIRISKINAKGDEFLVALLNAGEIFGESSIFEHSVRKEAAIAEEETVYCVLGEKRMKELLKMCPSLNLKFSRMIEEKMDKIQKRLEDLAFKSNKERIIEFLKEKASHAPVDPNGNIIIENSLSHEKIAMLTATNRQEVSSVLSFFKKNNTIDYNRKYIKILKIDELRMP